MSAVRRGPDQPDTQGQIEVAVVAIPVAPMLAADLQHAVGSPKAVVAITGKWTGTDEGNQV